MNKKQALKIIKLKGLDPNLAIFNGDKFIMYLSTMFLLQNDAMDDVVLIKEAFEIKFKMFSEMAATDDIDEIRLIAEELHCHEFIIQDLFNFEMDINFHRFWEFPKCDCPNMDNRDNWGTDWAVKTANCPIHGWESK